MAPNQNADRYYLGTTADSLRRYELFNAIYKPGTDDRLKTLPLRPDMNVLDVGCGIGITACDFAEYIVPDGEVTAFDPAADLVEAARARAHDRGLSNITFHVASAETFDFGSSAFDLAHTRYVLTYLSDAAEIVTRIHRALAPSALFFAEEVAQLFVSVGNAEWYEPMSRWFAALIEKGGGHPDYGLARLPGDMAAAGFQDISVSAYWPVSDQTRVRDMLRMALSREMKAHLVALGVATRGEIDTVVKRLDDPERREIISAAAAIQVVGKKL